MSSHAKHAPDPFHRYALRLYAFAAILLVGLGTIGVLGGSMVIAAIAPIFAGVIAFQARYFQRLGQGIVVQHKVLAELSAGHEAEATRLAGELDTRLRSLSRAVHGTRAVLALHAGRFAEAIEEANRATEQRTIRWTRHWENHLIAAAMGARAMAYASSDARTEAMRDIEALEKDPRGLAAALACAFVARCILAARAKDHAGLTRLLERAGENNAHLSPRNRTLVRAIRRMTMATTRSVYREMGEDAEEQERALASWVRTIAPGAERFVKQERARVSIPPTVPSLDAPMAAARVKPSPKRAGRAVVAVGVVAGMWLIFAGSGDGGSIGAPWWFGGFLALYAYAIFVLVRRRGLLADMRRLDHVAVLRARGEAAAANELTEKLVSTSHPLISGRALHLRATHREANGEWDGALADATRAIGLLSDRRAFTAAHTSWLPEAYGERAVIHALLGDRDQALSDLNSMLRDFPHFVYAPSIAFRVRLIQAARAGDEREALTVAESRAPDFAVPLSEDLLADLVITLFGQGSRRDDWLMLDGEVTSDPSTHRYLQRLAPAWTRALADRVHALVGPR